jgi:hypothetical protein
MAESFLPIEEFAREMGVDARELAARYQEMERHDLAALDAALNDESTRRPFECRAIGHTGRVAARIPEALFFNLYFKKGFGFKERLDAQDLREVEEMYPQIKVETVTGKIQSGYGSKRGGRWGASRPGVKFDTKVEFAK